MAASRSASPCRSRISSAAYNRSKPPAVVYDVVIASSSRAMPSPPRLRFEQRPAFAEHAGGDQVRVGEPAAEPLHPSRVGAGAV